MKNLNLMEIFDWYDQHKAHIQMANISRLNVEDILFNMRKKLEEHSSTKSI